MLECVNKFKSFNLLPQYNITLILSKGLLIQSENYICMTENRIVLKVPVYTKLAVCTYYLTNHYNNPLWY